MSLKVIQTVASFDQDTGGPAQSVPRLCSALQRAGVEIGIWVAEGVTESQFEATGIVPELLVEFEELSNLSPKSTVVHDHGLWRRNNWRIAELTASHGLARVVSPRGMLEPWAMNYKKWKKRFAWILYQQRQLHDVAALHSTATSETARIRDLGFENPVIELPNGVPIPELLPRETNKQERVALFLGRIHPKKGLPMLAEAWAKVKPAGGKMPVVGPEELGHRSEVQQTVDQLDLTDTWELHSRVDGAEKAQLLRECELFILPTYSENFGIAVAEALATGRPVITTKGAPWAGLKNRGCGWWTEPTVESLAQALSEATSLGSAQLDAMGVKGRAWVQEEFDWDQLAGQMIEAYEWLLSRGTPPTCVKQ